MTQTVLMKITHTLFMTSHLLYIWHNMHCNYISPTIYDITTLYSLHQSYYISPHTDISDSTSTVSLSSHPDYQSYNPHFIYDNTATICMTSYELHMISYPLFMISLHAMTSHPLYLWHHTHDTCHCIHCIWTITYSILIIPHLLYVWHETHYMYDITGILYDITLTLYDIKILYSWCHIQSIHDSTPTLYDITYSILAIS